MDQEAAEMARYHVLALIGGMALAATACAGGAGSPNGPSAEPAMSSLEANSFVDSLTRSLAQAAAGCQNRLPVRLGTSQINLSCGATRTCNGGGTIRPSFTATGQITIAQSGAGHWNSPTSGSQNILNWACATGSDRPISGNPTVSLSGQWNGAWTTGGSVDVSFQMRQSGQIIVGRQACGMNLVTTGDLTDVARTTGSICGLSIDRATTIGS
jgi:hypothetical protein